MDHLKYLRAAGVPADLHAQALASLSASRTLFAKVSPYKWKAPFMLARIVRKLPWEAEKMPTRWAHYDNEISLNGDHNPWQYDPAVKDFVRAPAPLNDTPEIRAQCYYAKGHHPRSRWARYIWLGWRNRASLYAFELGPPAARDIEAWGDPGANNGYSGITVWRMGMHWQIYVIKKWGPLCIRRNVGVKVSNVSKHGAERAMVVNIPFSLQRWKSKKKP